MLLEYIIGGNLLVLWFLITIYTPNKLTDLTVKMSERLKPGSWDNKSAKQWDQSSQMVQQLWTAVVGGLGAYIALVYAYPFMISPWI
jgi:hypothetical protein